MTKLEKQIVEINEVAEKPMSIEKVDGASTLYQVKIGDLVATQGVKPHIQGFVSAIHYALVESKIETK